jgi:hypothetical protein
MGFRHPNRKCERNVRLPHVHAECATNAAG